VDLDSVLAAGFALVGPHLTERQRRLLYGAFALVLGHGGVTRIAAAAHSSRPSVARGKRELALPPDPTGRTRAPGGGPKPLSATDPGVLDALDSLVDPDTRGDPCSPLRWTTKSLRQLADALGQAGHSVSATTVGRLLHAQGYSLQRTRKTLEGAQHRDRDAQFAYLNAQAKAYLAAGQPVVSVDTKKRNWSATTPTAAPNGSRPASPSRSGARLPRPRTRQGDPLRGLRPGPQPRLGQRRHRPRHRRVRRGNPAPLVGQGRQGSLPDRGPAAGHRPTPADPTATGSGRGRPSSHGSPPIRG
jgi:Rhodopirellula transposase DDE domain/Winged helix-turn helix